MNSPQPAHDEPPRSRLAAWARHHRRTLGLTWAVAAGVLAAVWLVVVPAKAADTAGVQELAIRWAHPACWVLLAGLGVLVAFDAPKRIRDGVGIAAAGCYAAFLAGMLL